MALKRYINPDREDLEMLRQSPITRSDNWGTLTQVTMPTGNHQVFSQDLIDIALPDDKACPITVTLAGPKDEANVGLLTELLFAELNFGTGGAFTVAMCDWVNGQRICVHAARLKLSAKWFAAARGPTQTVTIGAFAAHGTSTGHSPAQLTTVSDAALVPTGMLTLNVPPLARKAIILGFPANVPVTVQMLGGGPNPSAEYVVAAYPASLPIPSGSNQLTITNGGAVNLYPRVLWELDL